jgi:GT2 family glycosyltransferase
MDLSIIIVTCNSEKYILNCLRSISRSIQGLEHEILIIDNNSTDQTKILTNEFSNPVRLIENTENLGFAKALNLGLRASSGEFFLSINPDVIIESDSLLPMVSFMRANSKAGICGCKLLNGDGSLQYSTGSFPTLFSTIYRSVLPRRMRKYNLWGYGNVRECDWVTGAFMLIRNSLVDSVGYLDEGYFMYYEDVDYCLQAKKRGWYTYYYPGITACHLTPHSTSDKGTGVKREIEKSRVFFFKKNGCVVSYYALFFLTRMSPNKFLTTFDWRFRSKKIGKQKAGLCEDSSPSAERLT